LINMILLGPPGAGKGTQAELLVDRYHLPHISTGDIFRAAVKEGSPLGQKAKAFLDAGKLVPDDIVVGIVKERLNQPDCQEGFILDGFPRTIPQAEMLDRYLAGADRQITAVINIDVDFEVLIRRLTGRRVCRNCQAVYHIVNKPSQKSGVCDHCGGEIYQRQDDAEETVRKRLEVYRDQTAPLIAYYRERGKLKTFNGEEPIQVVFDQICLALEEQNG